MWRLLMELLGYLFPVENVSGEVVVTGKDSLSLKLPRCPKDISVYFKDEGNLVPCNPCQDDLIWVTEKCGKRNHKLLIKWQVDGIRTVVWNIKY